MIREMGRVGARRWIRLIAVFAIAVSAVVAGRPARACSCASVDIRQRLTSVEGGFVGTFVERAPLSDRRAAFTFEVEAVLKGEFGPVAVVRSSAQASACGLEFLDGPRVGLLLERAADGVWESDLCDQVPPDTLLASASATHPPDPSIEAIQPGAGPPWWGFMLVGPLVAVWLALSLRRRRLGGS